MEAGDCAAGDGHEQEREQLASDDGAAAVNELGYCGKLNVGMNDKDADDQQRNRSQLHVGGQIVSRLQQEPDRQDRRDEAIDRHHITRSAWTVEG